MVRRPKRSVVYGVIAVVAVSFGLFRSSWPDADPIGPNTVSLFTTCSTIFAAILLGIPGIAIGPLQ